MKSDFLKTIEIRYCLRLWQMAMIVLLFNGLTLPNLISAEKIQTSAEPVYFATDIVPILTRLGCNGGGCHGKASGQNGFKLSLLGFEPEFDYESLIGDARGRRLFPSNPEKSLILLKATGRLPHGGGRVMNESGDDYMTFVRWVERGLLAHSRATQLLWEFVWNSQSP